MFSEFRISKFAVASNLDLSLKSAISSSLFSISTISCWFSSKFDFKSVTFFVKALMVNVDFLARKIIIFQQLIRTLRLQI